MYFSCEDWCHGFQNGKVKSFLCEIISKGVTECLFLGTNASSHTKSSFASVYRLVHYGVFLVAGFTEELIWIQEKVNCFESLCWHNRIWIYKGLLSPRESKNITLCYLCGSVLETLANSVMGVTRFSCWMLYMDKHCACLTNVKTVRRS
jgi:hypothetical protein